MAGKEGMVYIKICRKRGCHCGHYAKPVHRVSCTEWWDAKEALASLASAPRGSGKSGGRMDSLRTANSVSLIGPQIRPWHGPLPEGFCSFSSVPVFWGRIKAAISP